MAPHDHAHIDTGQGRIVQIGPGKGLRHKARRGWEARRVVVADQIVVNGLGDVDAAQRVIGFERLLAHDAHGVRRIVATDVEKVLNLMRLQDLENLLAVGQVRFVTGGAQGAGGRVGHQLQVVVGFLRQIDKIFVHDATHTVACAVNTLDRTKAPRLQRHAHQRLVDHRRGAAALCNKYLSGCHTNPPE